MRRSLPLAVALATLLAAGAAARDPVRIAQAETSAPEEEKAAATEEGSAPEAAPTRPAASTATPPSDPRIEEIVVRGAESAAAADFDAGDSVTGFDASDLAALGAQTVADLDTYTPSLEIVTAGATTPTFFIRGIGLNDFNANSTGAVAIYQDDVAINAPALQLGTIFDVEGVNVLRGPQGGGPARNASAGAIKLYSRKPSGEFGGYLRSEFGNYDYRNFEGAIEAPIYEDLLSTRLAFRLSERSGYTKNRCGGLPELTYENTGLPSGDVVPKGPIPRFQDQALYDPALAPRGRRLGSGSDIRPDLGPQQQLDDPPRGWSQCGDSVPRTWPNIPANDDLVNGVSRVPGELPSKVNDLGNWAARGQVLFQPTLDMTWLVNAHGAKRDEQSELGQSMGVQGSVDGQNGILGGFDGGGSRDQDITKMLGGAPLPTFQQAQRLANKLDPDPWAGDYDRVGPTRNDTWGVFLRGEMVGPGGVNFRTVTAYDSYDRLIDTDLDMSQNILFEITTDDEGHQLFQDLYLSGQVELGDETPVEWNLGGFYLGEQLDVVIDNEFGTGFANGVAARDYTQKLWSWGAYFGLEWDFWRDFTLEGGFRYNWEQKQIDYTLLRAQTIEDFQSRTWQAPTGFIRLTYRFREDTYAYWKYVRGWKSGTFNATSSLFKGVTSAEPEQNDTFEVGLRGSWFGNRLGLDLSLFYTSYDQYQIFTVDNSFGSLPEFVILNANDAEVYGSEVNITARPWLGSFFDVRFGWLESQFLDFTQTQLIQRQVGAFNFIVVPLEIDNTGNRLLNNPRFKISLTAEQTVPLGRFGSITARYDGAWTDTTYFDATEGRGTPNIDGEIFLPENTLGQEPYWLHNAQISYRTPGGVEVTGWVRNITNQAYKTFGFNASTAPFFTTIYLVGEPRTFGLSLSVGF